jgi:hypothetical protein
LVSAVLGKPDTNIKLLVSADLIRPTQISSVQIKKNYQKYSIFCIL